MNAVFASAAQWASKQAGRAHTFIVALGVILAWIISGPLFGWSDTWQLIINTGTTIVTFLMVFLIQNTQNRDTEALQIKLDELIRVNDHARNRLLAIEDLSEQELDQIKAVFGKLADEAEELGEDLVDPFATKRRKEREPAATGAPRG